MLILVSNDDGVGSPGILALASTLSKIPKAKVVIVAPDREQSATSHALTLQRPLRIHKVRENCYSVDGTPTDAVMLAVNSILKKKPDIVVSGINNGANLGEDVHYSGTVAAAMEGAIMGIPAVAVSLVARSDFYFKTAQFYARKIVQGVLKYGIPAGTALNVNVPNLPLKQIKGVAFTRQGRHSYGGVIFKKSDPRGQPYYWIGGESNPLEETLGTDCRAYLDKKVSVTPIKVDLTEYNLLEKMHQWKF
ncbi:MAG TPA: 5'/3'-nucleotidase SurE [Deltaproteobacteria bacterium]|nr:MAG: 5'/3'-nucleotidase SurE [Deltaproteobacteria bacterium GWA2_45_12]HBF12532.1 5'/3'-nucleotidase SurE [Deltaproteobacteria bacterium]